MLCLLFQLGDALCAVEAARIVEVLPLVHMRPLPSSIPEVAGVLNHRGQPVPVVDLCRVHLGRAARSRLSTRILLFDPSPESSPTRLLGMIAERATEAAAFEPGDFDQPSPLGRTGHTSRGTVQWVDLDRLVPAETRASALALKLAGNVTVGGHA